MKSVRLDKALNVQSGEWRTYDTLRTWGLQDKEVYRSASEPSFVSWAILWKEQDGTLKLSFVEVDGDVTDWPPTYNFNVPGRSYYLKTMLSRDEGATWEDTGWKEQLDDIWDLNSDHHIRHVNVMADGQLIRNYCRSYEGVTVIGGNYSYDESKAWDVFPFTRDPHAEVLKKSPTIWTSNNGGQTWEEIYAFPTSMEYFISGIHVLKDGRIVAVGANNPEDVNAFEKNWIAITESMDGGKTWTPIQKLLTNDDHIISQGMCEEFDFVELDDGRLCMLMRADGMSMKTLQTYLEKDAEGKWHATQPTTNKTFVRSGYPYMHKASDGTIFYYTHHNIIYSCDDGATWQSLETGTSYYGQLVESSPGKIVAISQQNIGDASFPYVQDAYMKQTSFHYERTAVIEQTNATLQHTYTAIDDTTYSDFHMFVELRADGDSGIVFNKRGHSHHFVVLAIPSNEYRSPGVVQGEPQAAYLIVGKYDDGKIDIMRRQYVGEIKLGEWIALQLDVHDGVLKAAIKDSKTAAAKYMVIKDDFSEPGHIGFMTNYSTGAFKNMKLGRQSLEIRTNWGDYADAMLSSSSRVMKEHEY